MSLALDHFAMQYVWWAVSHIAMIISLGIYICCNEVQMLHLHITQQESLCDNAFKYLYFAKRIWNETIINSEYLAK